MNSVEIKNIYKNIYVITDMKTGFLNNCTVILTEEGPIIIDVFKNNEQFEYVNNFIRDKGFHAPAAIIYTHWHVDHTCGNRIFNNCKVIGHKSTRAHLEDFIEKDMNRLISKGVLQKDTKIILPNETFGSELQIKVGEKLLSLIHCPGHTYDSILVFDEKERILIAGDNIIGEEVEFFMPPTIPPDETDINYKYLAEAYKQIEGLNSNIIVPGHGFIKETNEMIELNKRRYRNAL